MKIANIVTIVTLNGPINLEYILNHLPNTERSGKSPWIKMRLPPNNTYIAFYKSGKFLITTKDPAMIDPIAQRVLALLHEGGINVNIVKTEIHNYVLQTAISLKGSLESIIVNLDPKKASFEPEQFPALIYKDWGVTFLIFSTGNVIITGLKDVKVAQNALDQLSGVISGS